MKTPLLLAFFVFTALYMTSCKEDPGSGNNTSESMYFPPISASNWERQSPADLKWNASQVPPLLNLLEQNGTRAFIILKNGRIVIEEYFGTTISGTAPFTQSTFWYWASAGKTLTALMVGIAQEDGFLNINQPTSSYLGAGWTSLQSSQEELITVRHQLTMTTGLDDTVPNSDRTTSDNLLYLSAPDTRWAYHNAPYTLLQNVVSRASNQSFESYFNSKLRNRIGMDGNWVRLDDNSVYFSTARAAARFAHLILNNGVWDKTRILNDAPYATATISTSQPLNLSYGYLWWLNGKSSFMIPQLQQVFQGPLLPNAPNDMACGIGANGQFVCIVPSMDLVLIRMGTAPNQNLLPFSFLDDIWVALNKILP